MVLERIEAPMTAKTEEERRSDMIDALEDLDDADREGKVLSRFAIAKLYAKVGTTIERLIDGGGGKT
jgi:hypothetical protein